MKPITRAWSPELEDLRQYHKVFPIEQFPALVPELTGLGEMTQGIDALNRARRLLEIIVIDLCKTDLQRERGTEPLKGILDRFAKDKIIPEHIISSMYNVNELGKYGSHPKDFDEQRQVREALLSLVTVLHWYAKHRGLTLPARYSTAIIDQEVQSYELEMASGAIPLESKFYVQRPVDHEFQAAIARRDSVVRLKGPRQVGKTSLLARGIQRAREAGIQVVLTDCQKLPTAQMRNLEDFLLAVSTLLAKQMKLSVSPKSVWDSDCMPTLNFETYFMEHLLTATKQPVLWALDEADVLFHYPFSSEVFSLLRSWFNERALNPTTPCHRLTIAIAYATESYLFIKDQNQSPFNVGTKLVLTDFTLEQLADLNGRYGTPLRTPAELQEFFNLVGGHPYLVRAGLNDLVTHSLSVAQFRQQATQDEGVYGDHLRRIVMLLHRDPQLSEIIRNLLRGRPGPEYDSFYRLRSAGILRGESKDQPQFRCQVYADYLKQHLLS